MKKLTHVIATDNHYMEDSGRIFAIKDKKYVVDREVEDGFYIASEQVSSPMHYFSFEKMDKYFIPVYEDEQDEVEESEVNPNENVLALDMAANVNNILRGIEFSDVWAIELSIRNLQENISRFQEIFYQNKADGMYN